MARALLEAGHRPDRLYGTSAGAFNAAWLAYDPSLEGLGALANLWNALRRHMVFPFNPWTVLSGLAGLADHAVNPRPFARWVRSVTPLRRLEDGELPLAFVATDIQTGEEVLLQAGPMVPALLASSAIPGVFPPVRIGGKWLVDGGVATDTPIGQAFKAGATEVWVLPCSPDDRLFMARPRSVLATLLNSSAIMVARQSAESVARWSQLCDVFVLPAPRLPGVSAFDFDHSQELMDASHDASAQWLKDARPVAPTTSRQ
jgi:NTE family protein